MAPRFLRVFDGSIGPNLVIILNAVWMTTIPLHTLIRFFCVRKKVFCFFSRRDGIFTLMLSAIMLGNYTVVLSLVDKLGIVGGSSIFMCF